MKRDIYSKLLQWKDSADRKPLILNWVKVDKIKKKESPVRGLFTYYIDVLSANQDASLLISSLRLPQRAHAICVSTAFPMYFFCSVCVPTRT